MRNFAEVISYVAVLNVHLTRYTLYAHAIRDYILSSSNFVSASIYLNDRIIKGMPYIMNIHARKKIIFKSVNTCLKIITAEFLF